MKLTSSYTTKVNYFWLYFTAVCIRLQNMFVLLRVRSLIVKWLSLCSCGSI